MKDNFIESTDSLNYFGVNLDYGLAKVNKKTNKQDKLVDLCFRTRR